MASSGSPKLRYWNFPSSGIYEHGSWNISKPGLITITFEMEPFQMTKEWVVKGVAPKIWNSVIIENESTYKLGNLKRSNV